jgi:DhnA family fructose-bisphosphate aldolase class Ia
VPTDWPNALSNWSGSSVQWGKRRRLSRLQRENGAYILLAADHGISLGPLTGLEDFAICNDKQITDVFSGVVLNRGAVPLALPCESRLGLIIQTFGSPGLGSEMAKRPLLSLEHLLVLSPEAIAVELNLSLPQASESMAQVSRSIQAADVVGMPVLLMISASTHEANIDAFVHAVRIGVELGADLIKIGLTSELCNASSRDHGRITSMVAAAPPVLLAGGPAGPRFPSVVKLSRDLGFSGVCIGRNIFGIENREAGLNAISEVYLRSTLSGGAS